MGIAWAMDATAARITLGFTTFRAETVPFAARAMDDHDSVFLEEPHTPGFEAMLAGELAVDDYLMLTEFEFPGYARALCRALQEVHARGAAVRQVHPWMDELAAIHEFLAAGHGPEDLPATGPTRDVYEREKAWTKALIAFYRTSGSRNFERLAGAVNAFARADALKIRDQDTARVRAVAQCLERIPKGGRVYVECGTIHQTMVLLLKRVLGPGRVRAVFVGEQRCKPRFGVRRLLPPGDVLTFRHLFQAPPDAAREALLAARAVVYNKLIAKTELSAAPGAAPHMDDEAGVIGLVSTLSFEQCRTLWERIRGLSTDEARFAARLAGQ